MSELALKAKVLRWLKTLDGLWSYKAADQFTSGIPDIICCFRGKFIAVELKFGKGTLSNLQMHTANKIEDAGGEFYCCRTLDEVKKIFEGR